MMTANVILLIAKSMPENATGKHDDYVLPQVI